MIRPQFLWLAAAFVTLLTSARVSRAEADKGPAPDFKDVYNLIREHLPGISEAELNRAAVQGLISSLVPKVSLVSGQGATASHEGSLVGKATLFEGQVAYLRLERIADGLAQAVREASSRLGGTNELSGLILDLRFTQGQDYAAAAAMADLFLSKERPLLDWGHGLTQSKEKSNAFTVPVAVLVNRETAGAAEALAAVLREIGAGLILGSKTAGQAMIAQDYPLAGGDSLRIYMSPIHLGDGSELPVEGVQPDIHVPVGLQSEKNYLADPFRDPMRTNVVSGAGSSGTNAPVATSRPRRPRFGEAELVRERREGYAPDPDAAESSDADADKNLVRDPVLARALDVLKGLAVVRRARS